MGKKGKNTIAVKRKKLLNASTQAGSLAKSVDSSVIPLKKENEKEEAAFYLKPIFKPRRFDLF